MNEIGKAYREFFKTELGKDLLKRIDSMYLKELKKSTSTDKEASWGFVNRAGGVEAVVKELKRLQSIDLKGVGRT